MSVALPAGGALEVCARARARRLRARVPSRQAGGVCEAEGVRQVSAVAQYGFALPRGSLPTLRRDGPRSTTAKHADQCVPSSSLEPRAAPARIARVR